METTAPLHRVVVVYISASSFRFHFIIMFTGVFLFVGVSFELIVFMRGEGGDGGLGKDQEGC